MKLFSLLVGSALGAKVNTRAANDGKKYIATELKFETQLRICNAYPYAKEAVQVFDSSVAYGKCVEVSKEVKAGEQIDFFTMKKQILIGSFEVQEVPQQNTLLLLVIQPHDSQSTGIAFQSHAYANVEDPQIALLDAYVGADVNTSLVDIRDESTGDSKYDAREEKLRFNSVVAVHPGSYEIGFAPKSLKALKVSAAEKVSVIRIGVKSQNKDFPEDVIVFPSSAYGASVAAAVAMVLAFNFF